MKKYTFFLVCLLLFGLFYFFASLSLDPDFGWHLRMGQLILAKGLPATDPFSYSMASYPFVDHEWLSNVMIALLYPKIGLNGLTFIFTLIAFAALFLQTITLKKKYLLFPFLLAGAAFIDFVGIRPQILSWFFVSVLLFLFFNTKWWQRLRFFLPFLILLWVNLHAGFALGIVLLGVFVFLRQLDSRLHGNDKLIDWIILIASIAVTFVNPYGARIWWEVWMQISDSSLRWSIQEWFPAVFFFNVGFMFLLPVSVVMLLRCLKKFKPEELILYFVLLFLGLSSTRHLPFWLLIVVPITSKALEYFTIEIKKIPFAQKRFKIFVLAFLGGFSLIFLINISLNIFHTTNSPFASYPEKAVAFLQTHPSKGNLFNHYNWGGYLIWKLPQEKVFVDGRMPSWRREQAPTGESINAFKEYQLVMHGTSDLKTFLTKYKIDTVLLTSGNEQQLPIWLTGFIEKVLGVNFPNQKLLKTQLQDLGMKVVYKDKLAVIYR